MQCAGRMEDESCPRGFCGKGTGDYTPIRLLSRAQAQAHNCSIPLLEVIGLSDPPDQNSIAMPFLRPFHNLITRPSASPCPLPYPKSVTCDQDAGHSEAWPDLTILPGPWIHVRTRHASTVVALSACLDLSAITLYPSRTPRLSPFPHQEIDLTLLA